MESYHTYVRTDDGKYYDIEWGKKSTYKQISEPEFYKHSGHKKSEIQALAKSVYPTQGNDYLLLKWEGQLYPVDYKLVPFVQYLWNHAFKTTGWNQPDPYNMGFVNIDHYTKTNESALSALEKRLKGIPITILDNREVVADFASVNKKIETLNKKGNLVIEINNQFLAIYFNESLFEKVLKRLGLKKNEKKLPGSVIVNNDYFQLNKISKKRA